MFGTLHTTTAISTVDRIVDQFPGDQQTQIRVMLADSLKAVIAQTLCRKIDGGRVAALECLIVNPAITALNAFWGAALKGTPEAIDPVLAPEFQIQRADGSGLEKEAYLKSQLAKFTSIPEFTAIDVTANGDILVVRYQVSVDSTREGKTVQREAPRLTVFRRDGSAWLVVAHANFAPVEL